MLGAGYSVINKPSLRNLECPGETRGRQDPKERHVIDPAELARVPQRMWAQKDGNSL